MYTSYDSLNDCSQVIKSTRTGLIENTHLLQISTTSSMRSELGTAVVQGRPKKPGLDPIAEVMVEVQRWKATSRKDSMTEKVAFRNESWESDFRAYMPGVIW